MSIFKFMSVNLAFTVLGLIAVCLASPAACWTSSHTLQCIYKITSREHACAVSKVRMAPDMARPQSTAAPKLFGSRRLYRWVHSPPKTDGRIYADDARGLELIKLITIAKLHADVEVEQNRVAYAPTHKNTVEIKRLKKALCCYELISLSYAL